MSKVNIKDKYLNLQHKIQPAVKTNEMVSAQIGNYTAIPLIRGFLCLFYTLVLKPLWLFSMADSVFFFLVDPGGFCLELIVFRYRAVGYSVLV